MRVHRFYIEPDTNTELVHDFWLHDEGIIHQWRKVLRFTAGQQVVLFDGLENERLYNIVELKEHEAHLQLVTDYVRKIPAKEIYLFWSLLKKDKNNWVLQKCTELGVSHFIPLLADRSEKTGFNIERAEKIVIEAAEQCGRSDIPNVRQPVLIATVLEEFAGKLNLYIAEQSAEQSQESRGGSQEADPKTQDSPLMSHDSHAAGVLIGPEGGWSDKEKQLFKEAKITHLNLHDFTLRAETACVAAVTKLIQ